MAEIGSPRGHLKAVSSVVREWPAVMRVRSSVYVKTAARASGSNGAAAGSSSSKAASSSKTEAAA
jgi:hypothetical protein